MNNFSKTLKTGMFTLMLSTMSVGVVSAESLNDALRWAYENNADLKATRAQVRQALEGIELAKAGKRPTFDFNANYGARNAENQLGERETNDSLYAELSAGLLLWDGGQTDLAIESALANVRSAQAQLASAEQQILIATVQAYLGVLEKQQKITLQQSNAAVLNKQVQSAKIGFEEGATTLAEVSAANAAYASAGAQVSLAEAELVSAQQDYKELTEKSPGKLASVGAPKIPSNAEAVVAEAVRNAPSLVAALEAERAAMLDYRRAQKNSNATLRASASASRTELLDGSDPSDDLSVGLSLNVPLNTGGRNPALERQARALLEQRSAQTNAARLSVAKAAQIAFARYHNAVNTERAYGDVVKAQSVANEGATVEFELGASTIVQKLDAEQNLLSARTNALDAEFARIIAAYNVLAAMGKMEISNVTQGVKIIDPIAPLPIAAPVKSDNAQAVEKLSDRWGKTYP